MAAEVLKTLVGSFGLVMVAPFTALAGGLIFTRNRIPKGNDQFALEGTEEVGVDRNRKFPTKKRPFSLVAFQRLPARSSSSRTT